MSAQTLHLSFNDKLNQSDQREAANPYRHKIHIHLQFESRSYEANPTSGLLQFALSRKVR